MMMAHTVTTISAAGSTHTASHGTVRSDVTGRVGVGVDVRFTVRLDTDPQTDPSDSPTAQVRPALSGADRFQTHPCVGCPPRAAHA